MRDPISTTCLAVIPMIAYENGIAAFQAQATRIDALKAGGRRTGG